ncbi:MAG: TrkH family potassium uptake protein [Enterocloster sp.]
MFGKDRGRHLSSFQIIILGFLMVIIAGSCLLTLPISTKDGAGAPFMDALFTATSAVCVTGLVVHDTATYWSAFGQGVILLMIQIGGMGVVTVAVSIARISGRKIGLMQRSTMQEAIAAPKVGGIVRLTEFILKVTFCIELLGAAVMFPVFFREFGLPGGLWYSLFHSVSAFCNAGFDLMGVRQQYSSLTSFAGQPVINTAVMLLIIVGGIGFLTWDDIKNQRWHWKKYRMQSKVILTVTGVLILFPTLYFLFFEFSRPVWDEIPLSQKLWMSLFQAVTPRTAGFNTADLSSLTEAGQTITIVLMLIGGSPGSTAGGMKTTTAAVLLFSALAVFRRRECAESFGRRIEGETIRQAAAILLMYLVLLLGGGIAISIMEELPVLPCFFEAASAIGTVGLTLGLTPGLGSVSRFILILLMFFGRVGGMTLVFAALSNGHRRVSKLPQEKITVG